MKLVEAARLGAFFGALALKEHLMPNLHVRPRVAELFLTDNCNLKCVSCACWRTTTKGELTTDEWRGVLDQLKDLRMHKVNFTGGEPLLRPDAIDLMTYASSIGIANLHLNSNAILLTPARIERILGAGVRSFNISIDGTSEVHDLIRGRTGSFDTTMTHLQELVTRGESYDVKVRMNFTVMRDNLHVLPAVARLAQRYRVQLYLNLVTDRTFLFRNEEVTTQTDLDRQALASALATLEDIARHDRRYLPRFADLRYIPRHFDDLVQQELPCAESQLKLMVHSRGEVGGCWGHGPDLSVRDVPLREVIESARYREEHARFFRKECVGCGSNYSLNLRWRPGTYVEDLLWRLGRRSLSGGATAARP